MISAQFRLGEPWRFALDLPSGDPAAIASVSVGLVQVATDNLLAIPTGGPTVSVDGVAYPATDDEPAGWSFEVPVDQQGDFIAGVIAMDSKVTDIGGDVTFSYQPVFVRLSNAAVA